MPKRTSRRTLYPPPHLKGHPPVTEEYVITSVRLTRDMWSFLRRAAEDMAAARGGRPDSSEVLREILQVQMMESLEQAHTVSDRAMKPEVRHDALAGALGIEDARPMSPEEFRKIRLGLRLTQEEMAARLRKDEMTVSRWERGVSRIKPTVALQSRALAKGRK
jgi:DNA-binding transcriptional regulator YiaG